MNYRPGAVYRVVTVKNASLRSTFNLIRIYPFRENEYPVQNNPHGV
jgi:hypothetical protein